MRLTIPFHIIINFAGMVFLGMTLFLAWETGTLNLLTTMRGLLFLLIGVIVCGLMIGWPLVALHRGYCMKLIQRDAGQMSQATMKTIRFTGTVIMVVQIIIIYFLVDFAFRRVILGT